VLKELKILGVKLDEHYICQALQGRAQLLVSKKRIEEKKKRELEYNDDADPNFYFIAGYTA
jgi:hypothetical protein